MENSRNIAPAKVERTSIVNLEKGKLPPQAIDLEKAILGAMMVDRNGLHDAIEILSDEVFYKDAHKYIFQAIFQLFSNNQPIDLLTVSAKLKHNLKLEVSGGDFYLIEITQGISSSAHIEYHSRIILQKYIQRKTISISSELIENSYNENVDSLELLESVYSEYGKITDMISVGKVVSFKTEVDNFLNVSQSQTVGVPSSIRRLTKHFNGYQNSDLVIVAARPGMGKTGFILNEIVECGVQGIPVAFYSLEMSTKQIIGRLLSIISGIDIEKINRFNLSNSEVVYLKECQDLLSNMPIFIDDTSGISPIELKIKLSKLKRERGIKICFVDYMQLMKIKGKKLNNRENEISEISQSLKNLAKDLNIPMIVLSQLSRSVEQRGSSKRPLLSDLRDSGSIEQDADAVIFIYRPEYYKIDEWDDDEQGSTENEAEFDIAKYRHGKTGVLRVACELRYMRFMDIEDKGQDIQGRFFIGDNAPKTPPPKPEIELPKISASEAFGPTKNYYEKEDDSDVPF